MVKELIHDEKILSQKSERADKADKQVAEDLLDTLMAHKDGCVGMAANMIGELKRIIAFDNNGKHMMQKGPTIRDGLNFKKYIHIQNSGQAF